MPKVAGFTRITKSGKKVKVKPHSRKKVTKRKKAKKGGSAEYKAYQKTLKKRGKA